jgi:hypothetical protein
MREYPETMRYVVNDRSDQWRRDAEARRMAGRRRKVRWHRFFTLGVRS